MPPGLTARMKIVAIMLRLLGHFVFASIPENSQSSSASSTIPNNYSAERRIYNSIRQRSRPLHSYECIFLDANPYVFDLCPEATIHGAVDADNACIPSAQPVAQAVPIGWLYLEEEDLPAASITCIFTPEEVRTFVELCASLEDCESMHRILLLHAPTVLKEPKCILSLFMLLVTLSYSYISSLDHLVTTQHEALTCASLFTLGFCTSLVLAWFVYIVYFGDCF